MELIKNWILSMCGAIVVVSVIKIFTENSTLKKSLNTFFAIFLMFYTIFPLKKIDLSTFDSFSFEDEDTSYEYTLTGYNKIVEETVRNICTENNVKVLDFNIDSYIDDEGTMCIKSLIIDIDLNEKTDVIKNDILVKTGFEVSVE